MSSYFDPEPPAFWDAVGGARRDADEDKPVAVFCQCFDAGHDANGNSKRDVPELERVKVAHGEWLRFVRMATGRLTA